MVHFICLKIENQEVLVKGSNLLVEPGTSGKKSEIGDLTKYQEDKDSPNQVLNREDFFLVGSWLSPEDFGFGHPL